MPKGFTQISRLLAVCLGLLTFTGCAPYFRTGHATYQELDQKNEEAVKTNQIHFVPGEPMATPKEVVPAK